MASTICFPSDPEVFVLTATVIALAGAASHSWAGRARALATSSACIRDLERAALWVTLSSGSGGGGGGGGGVRVGGGGGGGGWPAWPPSAAAP